MTRPFNPNALLTKVLLHARIIRRVGTCDRGFHVQHLCSSRDRLQELQATCPT